MRKLTAKQKDFVMYYSEPSCKKTYGNATQAAIKAVYSKKTAYSQGQRLLKGVEIKKAIKVYKAKIAKNIKVTREYLIEKLQSVIDNPEKNSDIVAATREIADLKGFHREPAENPENIANKTALDDSQRDLIRKIAAEITQKEAEKPQDTIKLRTA